MVKYVILGGGVIGCYTAYNLLDQNVNGKDIILITKHMPGDLSFYYASPFAGAVFPCVVADTPLIGRAGSYSYENLDSLRKDIGGSCLELTSMTEFFDEAPEFEKIKDFQSYVKDLKILGKNELPEGAQLGMTYTSWMFNAPLFMETIMKYLQSNGIQVIKKEVKHIDEAFINGSKIVFNCTGLGSRNLGGVNDSKVFPTRAQVVVVKAPHINGAYMRWGKEATYILKRPNSDDEVILGGFYQPENWTKDVLGHETYDILERTTSFLPQLLTDNIRGSNIKDLEIKRVVSAFRPSRHGGIYVKKEQFEDGRILIHNYGAGGQGYLLGLGLTKEAISLLNAEQVK